MTYRQVIHGSSKLAHALEKLVTGTAAKDIAGGARPDRSQTLILFGHDQDPAMHSRDNRDDIAQQRNGEVVLQLEDHDVDGRIAGNPECVPYRATFRDDFATRRPAQRLYDSYAKKRMRPNHRNTYTTGRTICLTRALGGSQMQR